MAAGIAITIREARDEDYAGVAAVCAAAASKRGADADSLQDTEAHRDTRCVSRWLVALHGSAVVGAGAVMQHAEMYHPRKFAMQLAVHPEWQRRGIGSALYARILRALAPYDPLLLRATAHDSQPRALQFLQHRGFREEMRFVEAELHVARCEPAQRAQTHAARSLTITTLADIANDARSLRALYALVCDARADAPLPDAHTDVPFEAFVERALRHTGAIPDAWFIAIADGACVGFASLVAAAEPDALYCGLTGVHAAYRRRGIATALKLRAMDYARARGYTRIKTACAARNAAMRQLNAQLGFVEVGMWISFVREFEEGGCCA